MQSLSFHSHCQRRRRTFFIHNMNTQGRKEKESSNRKWQCVMENTFILLYATTMWWRESEREKYKKRQEKHSFIMCSTYFSFQLSSSIVICLQSIHNNGFEFLLAAVRAHDCCSRYDDCFAWITSTDICMHICMFCTSFHRIAKEDDIEQPGISTRWTISRVCCHFPTYLMVHTKERESWCVVSSTKGLCFSADYYVLRTTRANDNNGNFFALHNI